MRGFAKAILCPSSYISVILDDMNNVLNTILGLLLAAILVAIITKKLSLPYTVGLVAAGICLVFSPLHVNFVLIQNIIFQIILPLLLFEAAINIRWKEFRQDAAFILTLATIGTLIAAATITAIFYYILHWPFSAALVFGALISATDPVTVIATFKENKVPGRLRVLVESESLLNDGVAAVLFALALTWVNATGLGSLSAPQIALMLVETIGGGIFVGGICAAIAILLAGRTADHLVESTISTALAYASFMIAQHFHGSGILAVVTSGLIIGNFGLLETQKFETFITPKGRQFTFELWDYIAFLANSFVFLLIGLAVAQISFLDSDFKLLLASIAAILISRAATIYPLCALFCRSRWKINYAFQHVLWWGGLRGALAIALALSLPETMPLRDVVIMISFAIVAFSIFVQGLTMPVFLRFLKITRGS